MVKELLKNDCATLDDYSEKHVSYNTIQGKIQEEMVEAINVLNRIAELIENTSEYHNKDLVLHNRTVDQFNNIILLILNLIKLKGE